MKSGGARPHFLNPGRINLPPPHIWKTKKPALIRVNVTQWLSASLLLLLFLPSMLLQGTSRSNPTFLCTLGWTLKKLNALDAQMDVAGTFFPILTTILIALLIKSVSFHFANFSDLYELCFFEFSSVHLPPHKNWESRHNGAGKKFISYCLRLQNSSAPTCLFWAKLSTTAARRRA